MSALSAAAQDEDGDIIKTLQARVADLEAQLYAVGAGGVGSTVARQDHPEQNLDMVPEGWKLVPVEPTEEMLRSSCGCGSPAMFRESLRRETDGRLTAEMVEKIVRRHLASYRAMLAAAPKPPTAERSSGVQPPVEQEPFAWTSPRELEWGTRQSEKIVKLTCKAQPEYDFTEPLYTHPQNLNCKSTQARLATLWGYEKPQPKREPLTDAQINGHRLALPYDGEDLPDPWDFKQGVRAAERAHRIGVEA